MSVPVALLLYRRPALLERTFAAVAGARPRRLFLIADGPASEAERAACAAAREVVERVSWPCDVQRLYAETNLGLRRRVATGLDWVFEQTDEAIILEDDCLPDPSFFGYCQTLLERYRSDERLFGIAGTNLQFGRRRSPHSYYFSGYCGIWGWATWKRAWRHYDRDMREWPVLRDRGVVESMCEATEEARYWRWIFDSVHGGRIDTWDYQLLLAMWSQHALFITPEVNLVSNIGFGADSTHTWSPANRLSALPAGSLGELTHPRDIFRHGAADRYVSRHVLHTHRPLWIRRMARALRGG